ncbi:MAG TPA: hypothetical protein VJ277_08475, partial [Gemmatimonadales bacterium]|nr:hypothetical protein [Gemmatimonadales bacterium]
MHGVERLAHLADLVVRRPSRRCLRVDVKLLTRPQAPHGAGQFAPGDLQGGVAEADQLHDERAPDAYGDDERGRDGEESEEDGRSGGAQQRPGDGAGPVRGAFA